MNSPGSREPDRGFYTWWQPPSGGWRVAGSFRRRLAARFGWRLARFLQVRLALLLQRRRGHDPGPEHRHARGMAVDEIAPAHRADLAGAEQSRHRHPG